MMKKNNFFMAVIHSFGYAFAGILTLVRSQRNARIHLLATIVVTGLGFYFEIKRDEWLWLIMAMTVVWVAEGLNTALEFLTDLASPEIHPLAKKAKDTAAGAVLIAAIAAAIIGLIIFIPYFSNL